MLTAIKCGYHRVRTGRDNLEKVRNPISSFKALKWSENGWQIQEGLGNE